MSDELTLAISDLEEEKALRIVKERLEKGDDPMAILASCQEGMMQVGARFETCEYFISDLMLAGDIFKSITAPLEARIVAGGGGAKKGKIVFGTVQGDIHNIGKDIVVGLLRAGGYEVTDLGIDVPPERFVEAVKETGAAIVGLSGLLTVAYQAMKETIFALNGAGLKVKVMIGGGPMTAAVKEFTGADAWAIDAQSAVRFANLWTGGGAMSIENTYQERLERINKAMRCEPVDRVPVIYIGTAFSARYMGMSIAEFCASGESSARVTLEAMDRLSQFGTIDGSNTAPVTRITPALTTQWLSRIMVPGRDLPASSLWQVKEQEIMTQADYDFIIEKGYQAFLGSYLPKVIDMGEFQQFMNEAQTMAGPLSHKFQEHGYYVITGGFGSIPFEFLCGGRSMEKFFLDLYRMPDKVQAAMDAAFPDIIGMTIGPAKMSGRPGVWLGGWRSASALLAPKLWNRFVWPYFVKFAYALIDAGLTPILHLDQDWTRDLARLQELPPQEMRAQPRRDDECPQVQGTIG